MKILQFTCTQNPPVEQLKTLMVEQINAWSRLGWLTSDPAYVTSQFDHTIWREHTTTPGLWWLSFDDVYNALGNDGRAIADQFLGDGPLQGLLLAVPLVPTLPGTQLQLIEVSDLVAAGYLYEQKTAEYFTG
jgi:hypothetical protein